MQFDTFYTKFLIEISKYNSDHFFKKFLPFLGLNYSGKAVTYKSVNIDF